MGTDVAAFAKQLKEDGVEAARQEAEQIKQEARTEADRIIAEAKSAADKFRQEAESELAKKRTRFEAELQLVARDLMLNLKQQVEAVATSLLKDQVTKAFSREETIREAILEVLKSQESGLEWELALGPTVGKSLAELSAGELFKEEAAAVQLTDGFDKAGFELRGVGGSEVIEVSDESTAEAFRRLMSPELKKILDAAGEQQDPS